MAIVFEETPRLPLPPHYRANIEPIRIRAPNMDSPLSSRSKSFSENYESLHMDKATAMIIDQMRFLTFEIIAQFKGDYSLFHKSEFAKKSISIRSHLLSLPSAYDEVDRSHRNDLIYEVCRMAALVYTKSILNRIPFSKSLDPDTLQELYTALLILGRNAWDHIPGILFWVIWIMSPAVRVMRIMKRWIISSQQRLQVALGFHDWEETIYCIERFLLLQRIIREGSSIVAQNAQDNGIGLESLGGD